MKLSFSIIFVLMYQKEEKLNEICRCIKTTALRIKSQIEVSVFSNYAYIELSDFKVQEKSTL